MKHPDRSIRLAAALATTAWALLGACSRPGPDSANGAPRDWTQSALSVPTGFVAASVVSGLEDPTAMAFAPDGRLFVCEQRGALRVIAGGQLLPTPFVTLPVDPEGERGLLGVAFDPAFATTRLPLRLSTPCPASAAHNRVSRFRASASNPNVVDATFPELMLLELDPLSGASNHNGGAIHFGADGKLYVAVGENANGANAQSLSNLLGKMLRLEPDGKIPADNPFVTRTTGRNQAIWALGPAQPLHLRVPPGARRACSSTTWAAGRSRRSTRGWPGPTTAGPSTEGPTSSPGLRGPSSLVRPRRRGLRDHRRRLLRAGPADLPGGLPGRLPLR